MQSPETSLLSVKDDITLVQLVKSGNQEAFLVLISRYELFIKMHASSAGVSWIETEDLIQEGTLGLLSAIRHYRTDGGASFRTFALLCIKRKMSTALKAASSHKHSPLNNYLSLDEADAGAAAQTKAINPEDMIISREDIGALKEVIENSFTSSEQRLLSMYISGMSYAAMAKALNVSTKYVDNSLQRLKRKLSLRVSS